MSMERERALLVGRQAKVTEPEEITEWKWYNLNNLPEKMFLPSSKMIKAYLSKKIYGQ